METKKQYLVIHGHFYQPPRENPWTQQIPQQASAQPFHDWNERITAECYTPNTRSHALDGQPESSAMDHPVFYRFFKTYTLLQTCVQLAERLNFNTDRYRRLLLSSDIQKP